MTQTELARRLEVPYQRVNQIVNRRRAVTPDTALRLARLFATSPEFWLELQLRWELSEAEVQAPAPAVVRERAAWTASAAILDEIVARLVEVVDPQKIVLFGSSVTGEAGPRSDVDLLVVDRETFGTGRSRRRQLARIHGALSGLGIAKDILLYSADEVDRWRRSPNHIIARALEQGRVLYERS
jgi:addiction module HigA family antidote